VALPSLTSPINFFARHSVYELAQMLLIVKVLNYESRNRVAGNLLPDLYWFFFPSNFGFFMCASRKNGRALPNYYRYTQDMHTLVAVGFIGDNSA